MLRTNLRKYTDSKQSVLINPEYYGVFKEFIINDEMTINKDFYSPELFSYTFDIFKKLKDFFIFLSQVVDNSKH